MYRCFVVMFVVVLLSGCFYYNLRIVSRDYGLRDKFFEEHTIPYEAPQKSQELCKIIIDSLDAKDTSAFTQEIYDYLQSPDFVGFSFQSNEFIGMGLNYVLMANQKDLSEATFLHIEYQKNVDKMTVAIFENGQDKKRIEITDPSFKEKIYAVEKNYQEYIEEGKRTM